jgi:hypothetical protein
MYTYFALLVGGLTTKPSRHTHAHTDTGHKASIAVDESIHVWRVSRLWSVNNTMPPSIS